MNISRNQIVLGIVLLVVGLIGGAAIGYVIDSNSSTSEQSGFPTGRFVSASGIEAVEFIEDGTCRWYSDTRGWEVPCKYAVNGDLLTEMTFEWSGGPQTPSTYYWTYDGKNLSFKVWGGDPRSSRQASYDGQTLVKEE